MASQQSILSRILPRIPSPQESLDLLEVLRELDLELDFARGVPAGRTLIVFPKTCARAFLRAHQALESVKVSPMEPTLTDVAKELLNRDQVFTTTAKLTAWMDSIQRYVDNYLVGHRPKRSEVPSQVIEFRSSSCESDRFQHGDHAEGILP